MTSDSGASSGGGSTSAVGSTGAATDSGGSGSTTAPTSGATTEAASTGASAVCGDGIVAPEEICDDGNDVPEDGCDANCQKTGAIVWTKSYNGPGDSDEFAEDVAVDKDGRIVIVGHQVSAMNKNAMMILVLDPDGNEVWNKVIPGEVGLDASLRSVVIGDDGTIYVAGYDYVDDVKSNAIVRSFAPDGKEGWTFAEQSPDPGYAVISDLEFAGGALVSVGQEELADPGTQITVRKHAVGDGKPAWKTTSQAGQTWAYGGGIAVTKAGIVVVGGASPSKANYYPLILRLDDKGVAGPPSVDPNGDAGLWLDVKPIGDAGDVVLAGRFAPPGVTEYDYTVRRLGPDGAEQWSVYYDQDQLFDQANGVSVGPDGGVFTAGVVTKIGENDNVLVRSLTGDGDVVWSSTYNDVDLDLNDIAAAAAHGPDFAVAVGFTLAKGQGANVWARRYALD